jgi:hypothetical protein
VAQVALEQPEPNTLQRPEPAETWVRTSMQLSSSTIPEIPRPGPSTLGTFLRTFTFGHLRQFHAVVSRFLIALAANAPLLPGADQGCYVDIDDTKACGGRGLVTVHADSAYYGHDVIAAARRAGARFSITARMNPTVVKAISRTKESAWTPIHYPNAI